MKPSLPISRRTFTRSVSLAAAGFVLPGCSHPRKSAASSPSSQLLGQFDYGDVELVSELHEKQLENTRQVLMGLSEDSMLKPLRQMSGMPAPGEDMGGWYHYEPNYVTGGYGFAPACHFGQWVSALARMYAIRKDPAIRDKVLRLNRLYAQTISGDFY